MDDEEDQVVEIDYTNWKGERRTRKILPVPGSMFFSANEFHKVVQWFIIALDLEKDEYRTFAMKDIYSWKGQNGKGNTELPK